MKKIKELIGKNVFVLLNSGSMYNGVINEVSDDLFEMTDKFGESVFISISDIKFLKEKKYE